MIKKIIALSVAGLMLVSNVVSAAGFSDMPDNWTTKSLERAVENGLLQGDKGKIMPDDNITRAQMAAIIVRAFGADKEADISEFVDVSKDAWYYSEFSRAVYMDAFNGDGNKLKPNSFITYEECFTVVSRVMGLKENNPDALRVFDDYSSIAKWAEPYMISVVGNGYWKGIDNKLKPKDYITRSEFAVLMDNLVTIYINEPGTYSEFEDGNILIRSEDVIIDGLETDDVIFIGDGVKNKTVLSNINSTNSIVVRGGTAEVSGKINDMSALGHGASIDISKVESRSGGVYLKYNDTSINLGNVVWELK